MVIDQINITEEMERLFIARLNLHRDLVRNNLILMAGYSNLSFELLFDRAEQHDISKFKHPERIAYLYITWKYHHNISSYPESINKQIEHGWLHHIQNNRHHPEAHQNINKMTELDIVEMVCDWTAIAQENDGNNSSCMSWAMENIDKKWCFSSVLKSHIFAAIYELDMRRGII